MKDNQMKIMNLDIFEDDEELSLIIDDTYEEYLDYLVTISMYEKEEGTIFEQLDQSEEDKKLQLYVEEELANHNKEEESDESYDFISDYIEVFMTSWQYTYKDMANQRLTEVIDIFKTNLARKYNIDIDFQETLAPQVVDLLKEEETRNINKIKRRQIRFTKQNLINILIIHATLVLIRKIIEICIENEYSMEDISVYNVVVTCIDGFKEVLGRSKLQSLIKLNSNELYLFLMTQEKDLETLVKESKDIEIDESKTKYVLEWE